MITRIKELLFTVAFSLLLVSGFNLIFAVISVDGISMNSTLIDNSFHISLRSQFAGEIEKGDIIFFEARIGEQKVYLIKRVIGIAGDTIAIKDNTLFINGVLYEESYINEPMTENEDMEIKIGEGEYFVMGDNRNYSIDSRAIGTVPIGAIRGKLVL